MCFDNPWNADLDRIQDTAALTLFLAGTQANNIHKFWGGRRFTRDVWSNSWGFSLKDVIKVAQRLEQQGQVIPKSLVNKIKHLNDQSNNLLTYASCWARLVTRIKSYLFGGNEEAIAHLTRIAVEAPQEEEKKAAAAPAPAPVPPQQPPPPPAPAAAEKEAARKEGEPPPPPPPVEPVVEGRKDEQQQEGVRAIPPEDRTVYPDLERKAAAAAPAAVAPAPPPEETRPADADQKAQAAQWWMPPPNESLRDIERDVENLLDTKGDFYYRLRQNPEQMERAFISLFERMQKRWEYKRWGSFPQFLPQSDFALKFFNAFKAYNEKLYQTCVAFYKGVAEVEKLAPYFEAAQKNDHYKPPSYYTYLQDNGNLIVTTESNYLIARARVPTYRVKDDHAIPSSILCGSELVGIFFAIKAFEEVLASKLNGPYIQYLKAEAVKHLTAFAKLGHYKAILALHRSGKDVSAYLSALINKPVQFESDLYIFKDRFIIFYGYFFEEEQKKFVDEVNTLAQIFQSVSRYEDVLRVYEIAFQTNFHEFRTSHNDCRIAKDLQTDFVIPLFEMINNIPRLQTMDILGRFFGLVDKYFGGEPGRSYFNNLKYDEYARLRDVYRGLENAKAKAIRVEQESIYAAANPVCAQVKDIVTNKKTDAVAIAILVDAINNKKGFTNEQDHKVYWDQAKTYLFTLAEQTEPVIPEACIAVGHFFANGIEGLSAAVFQLNRATARRYYEKADDVTADPKKRAEIQGFIEALKPKPLPQPQP